MPAFPTSGLKLGTISGTSEPLHFPEISRATHLYVCGATGTGKTKFLENLVRQDILRWGDSKCGLLLLDPHGALYDNLIEFLSWNQIEAPIVPIDLRRTDSVIGYNLLRDRPLADPGVIVRQFVEAMAYVWGESGTGDTPRFATWASTILRTLYEKKLSLVEAEYLIDPSATATRRVITEGLTSRFHRRNWATVEAMSAGKFEERIESTVNRLHSFLSTEVLRRMFGQVEPSFDMGKAMEEGQIVLVNLASKNNRVSEADASLFATLLLTDLWSVARERGKENPKPFRVYIDEFQNCVTPTIAKNLDQARGFGLHLTLAQQFPNQLLHTGANGKQVYDSVFESARSKVVFSLRTEENLRPLVQDLFSDTFDTRKVKLELSSTKVMGYEEETRISTSQGTSSVRGGGSQSGQATGAGFGNTVLDDTAKRKKSHSHSDFASKSKSESDSWSQADNATETESAFLRPVLGQEVSNVQFEPIEEQVHKAMAILRDRKQRHAVVRLVESRSPTFIETPTVKRYPADEEMKEAYLRKCLEALPFALTTAVADERVRERGNSLEEAANEEPKTAKHRVR